MAEDLETVLEQPSEPEKRIKQLSEKVRLTSEESAEKDKLLQERDEKIANLEKENSFNAGFADTIAQNPQAKEFKDDIKAKVMGGYSLEDATYAVLGKAGKLNQSSQSVESPAGGSAATTVTQKVDKSPKEMKSDELRTALEEAEKKGDITWS